MPTYESSISKDKTPNKILSRMETRLRTPFLIDMDTEVAAISELIFALQSENSPLLQTYTKEVLEIRSQLMMNKEFMSRKDLAKLLSGLFTPQSKLGIEKRRFYNSKGGLGILKAVESFRKMPLYKPEMVKSANFNTRQETNSLLPKERKPNFFDKLFRNQKVLRKGTVSGRTEKTRF